MIARFWTSSFCLTRSLEHASKGETVPGELGLNRKVRHRPDTLQSKLKEALRTNEKNKKSDKFTKMFQKYHIKDLHHILDEKNSNFINMYIYVYACVSVWNYCVCFANNSKQSKKVKKQKKNMTSYISVILSVFIDVNERIPRKCSHPLLSIKLTNYASM